MTKKVLIAGVFSSLQFILFSETLPHLFTTISRNPECTVEEITFEKIQNFTSTEEVLESAGLSFKESNNELTYHGYWNSSIKVFVNDILMNDPNTGKFDFSTLDVKSIQSVKIDSASTSGAVSVYIYTIKSDYTKKTLTLGGISKSYFSAKDISLNDTCKLWAGGSIPLIFSDGSSVILEDNFSAGYKANHFGYVSKDSTYLPVFTDSYIKWPSRYGGWENTLLNNSLSLLYSISRFPGATFGLSNYISFNDQNCGRNGGVYYNYENQKDLNLTLGLPVFLPFEHLQIKLQPSYRFSNLDYSKDAAFTGKTGNLYQINNLSFSGNADFLRFFSLETLLSYDFSSEKTVYNSALSDVTGNSLFTAFVSPKTGFSFGGFDFSFSVPVSYFHKENQWNVLYSAQIKKDFPIILREDEDEKTSESSFEVFFKASRNITNPVFQQLYYNGGGGSGNPNLKPETAFSFYTGAAFRGLLNASIKPFLIFYKDKIGWISDSLNNWSPQNTGSSTNYGFDFYFDSDSLFSWFRFESSYTLCRAFLTTNESVFGKQIMYTPLHSFYSSVSVPFGGFAVWNATYRFTSKKYISNDNTFFVPAQHKLDSKLTFKIDLLKTKKTARLQTEIWLLWENILDFKYTEVQGYPGSGTSFTLGASIKA